MNVSDIKFSLGTLRLPLYGFAPNNWHIFVTTPKLKDLVAQHTMFNKAGIGYSGISGASRGLDNIASLLTGVPDNPSSLSYMVPGPVETLLGFYSGISPLLKLSTITFPRLHWLRSYMFLGVQPQTYKGFTCLNDPKYDSGEDSFMRYVLSPHEYIIYNATVHSCCDGEVAEIRDGVQDNIREDHNLKFGSTDVEEHLGNMIRINHGACQLTYGGLRQGSIRVKKGDTVKKGDVIAKVGASAYSRIPFLYLGVSYIGPKIPIAGNLGIAFRNEAIFWEEHFQCPLLNQLRNGLQEYNSRGDIFASVDPYHLKYTLPRATRIPDLALVRRFAPGVPCEH